MATSGGPDRPTRERIHETIAQGRAALATGRRAVARSRDLVASMDRQLARRTHDGEAVRRRIATLAVEEARLATAIQRCAERGEADEEDRLRNRAQVVRGHLERLRREADG